MFSRTKKYPRGSKVGVGIAEGGKPQYLKKKLLSQIEIAKYQPIDVRGFNFTENELQQIVKYNEWRSTPGS